jgi:excisionase family DNA binding protein
MKNTFITDALTIQEVATICGVKPVTVRAWISRREIASTKVNNRRYISERQITDFYRNRGNEEYVDHTYAPRKHVLND